ncbi:MAG TPA: glycosyltransferase family 4 protein [Candidatus Magasanikbacteria bacterium]|nr:glycosyltransferase family 4 protein [Candidatus Magasanikbacteria bacterium]
MKILLITLEYPPKIGGIASYTYNFAAHFDSEEICVYAPKQQGDKEFDAKNDWKTYRYNPYFKVIWPRWLKMFWQVRKIIKKEKVEKIYVHHALPSGYVAYLCKKFFKIPYTIFFHGTDLVVGLKRKAGKIKMVCNNAEKIVVSGDFLKNKLSAKFEELENKIVVLHPCPSDFFLKKNKEEELEILRAKLALKGKKVLISVGRMADGKGFPHMVRLLPKILEKVPNLVWIIIGDGPKKEDIIKNIQKNYLQNVVRILGFIPLNELPKYYQLADAFVLLTHKDEESEEGWGTAFLEASASGLPVIAGRVGGVEEVVENLVTGILVDVYQDQGVISAITEILKNSDYAKQMGEAGRRRIIQEFNWEKQIAKLE